MKVLRLRYLPIVLAFAGLWVSCDEHIQGMGEENIENKEEQPTDSVAPAEPKFPTLEVKGANLNTYTANIFDPVHFYLEGDEYMNLALSQLCDSLVFDVMAYPGLGSRKIYYNEDKGSKLIYRWEHRFYLPINGLCRIRAYKNGKVVYTDGVSICVSNDKDFLMYNWDEVADADAGNTGHVNFIDPRHELSSMASFKDGIPYIKVFYQGEEEVAQEWLYDYAKRMFKEPAYSESAEVDEKYSELFLSKEDNETPICIWLTEKSVISLVASYNDVIEITDLYIKAEPIRE